MTAPHTDERLRQVAAALAAPDRHIPPTAPTGIDPAALRRAVGLFRSAVFAGYFDPRPVEELLAGLSDILTQQIALAHRTCHEATGDEAGRLGEKTAAGLLGRIPELRRRLGTDVQAVFDGDPAATTPEEVILCYPALTAMTHYRLAHALLQLGVPILPRLITEMAHSETGIDIHPGAEIGDFFSIDHGTGVVIGETCIIGSHVRLYQGVDPRCKAVQGGCGGEHPARAASPDSRGQRGGLLQLVDSGAGAHRTRHGDRRQRLADHRPAAPLARGAGPGDHIAL